MNVVSAIFRLLRCLSLYRTLYLSVCVCSEEDLEKERAHSYRQRHHIVADSPAPSQVR